MPEAATLPVVAVGAGAMGREWLRMLHGSTEAELVGIVDLDLGAARAAAEWLGLPDLPIGADAVELASATGARAVIDVTVPAAHHPVTTQALFAGLPVLGEKPAAATLAQTLSLAAAAEVSGQLFMVSQSRRWNPQLAVLRQRAAELGGVGSVSVEFFRGPHFGGFREAMAQPLLVDMAIHHFDAARYLLADEPVSVYCESWNPTWSWYAGDASASAVIAFAGGARLGFQGSWCAPGDETSWNGRWHVSGALGTATWSGDDQPVATSSGPLAPPVESPYDGIAGSLAVFVEALRTGTAPSGEVHDNAMSLATVEAAVESARTGRRVMIDDVLARALARAIADERRDEVRERLRSWGSAREALLGASAVAA